MISYYCESCGIDTEQSLCPVCGKRTKLVEKTLYWCEHCQIPTYEEICPLCGERGTRFTSDARPVFPEERLLIELVLGKPFAYLGKSVWNGTGNRYYADAKRIPFQLSDLRNVDVAALRADLVRYRQRNEEEGYPPFQEMVSRLVAANQNRFHYISTEACQYILECSHEYQEGGRMFVSFSGGKDSTVVSDLVRRALSNPAVIHIFGDTTLEFPLTYQYIDQFRRENPQTPVLRARNGKQDFFTLCEEFGPPSRSLRWCCTVFKTGYIGEKIRKTFGDRGTILTFYGIRRMESNSRSNYDRESTGEKITQQHVASPIIDWSDFDIWLYLLTTGILFNPAYRLGYTRVGCWCCPNNTEWAQFLSSVYLPEESARFRKVLLDFAEKMGKKDPEEYVDSGGWKARQGGAGMEGSSKVAVRFQPCATDEKSFNYALNRPIEPAMYEFFKPFGILDFSMGNQRLGEVYILDPVRKSPIMKLQGRIGSSNLRISVLDTPIADRTKMVEIELKFRCQVTKYQLCASCHACESVCPVSAIKLNSTAGKFPYEVNERKCIHCYKCINHYNGGCYIRRVLLPRGEGYQANDGRHIEN